MLRKITFIFISIAVSGILISGITNGNQAPYGHTGSPTDGKNCTFCHSGTAQADNNISTNIPNGGYTPGATYQITISASKAGINKYGFQLTAENSSGTKVGTFQISDASQTKMVQNEVTHTGLGTAGTNNQKTWTVNWVAPSAGTGTVTFYSAVNAANADGGTSGDIILVSSAAVQEDLNTSISQSYNEESINVYPTIATNSLNVSAFDFIETVQIFSINGQMVKSLDKINQTNQMIDISDLSSGSYFVKIKTSASNQTIRFFKQ